MGIIKIKLGKISKQINVHMVFQYIEQYIFSKFCNILYFLNPYIFYLNKNIIFET